MDIFWFTGRVNPPHSTPGDTKISVYVDVSTWAVVALIDPVGAPMGRDSDRGMTVCYGVSSSPSILCLALRRSLHEMSSRVFHHNDILAL